MTATQQDHPALSLPRRIVFAAAVLTERYQNPDVAAYSRMRDARNKRQANFWHQVGRALYRHPHGCPTSQEMAERAAIRLMCAAIRKCST